MGTQGGFEGSFRGVLGEFEGSSRGIRGDLCGRWARGWQRVLSDRCFEHLSSPFNVSVVSVHSLYIYIYIYLVIMIEESNKKKNASVNNMQEISWHCNQHQNLYNL